MSLNRLLKRFTLLLFFVSVLGPALVACSGTIKFGQDWRTADRSSTGVAPLPEQEKNAVVQVYAARAFNWRGIFAVHTWIATKEKDAAYYRVHQVVGWRSRNELPVVVSEPELPDRSWYGYTPEILVDIRGEQAEKLIPRIDTEVQRYRYQHRYTLWPGPNSNSFVAAIGRRLPELQLALPATAIGKDYLGGLRFVDRAPSGTGVQFSLLGVVGLTLARREGLEVNILTLNFGFNPLEMKLELPGLGTLGGSRDPWLTTPQ